MLAEIFSHVANKPRVLDIPAFMQEWGIDIWTFFLIVRNRRHASSPEGGCAPRDLFITTQTHLGCAGLGKTTGGPIEAGLSVKAYIC